MWTEIVGKDRDIFLFNRLWLKNPGTGTVQQANKSTSQDAWCKPPVQIAALLQGANLWPWPSLALRMRGPPVRQCDIDPILIARGLLLTLIDLNAWLY